MIFNESLKYFGPKKLIFSTSKINLNKNDVLIEIKSCGICGSDLKILSGANNRVNKNRVIGHEIAGKIKYAPKSQKFFKKNQNILLGADIENKSHKDLALGHEIDGGFQKYLKINYKLLKKIPYYITKKKINYDIASLAEPLACCLNGLEQIRFEPNMEVLIFGAGPIGQLIAKLCIYFKSKKVFLVEQNKYRIKNGFRHKKLIKLTFEQFKSKFQKNKIKFIFVACSSIDAQKQAVELAGNNSSINFFAGLKKINNKEPLLSIKTNEIHYKQLKIVGSHGSKFRHLKKAGSLIVNKKIKFNELITHRYDLKNYKKAFQKLSSSNSLKIIIKPNLDV